MKCTRCGKLMKPVFDESHSQPSGAMDVILTGGYGQWRDDYDRPEGHAFSNPDAVLCHRCGHELVDFLRLPREVWVDWHMKENNIKEDPQCNGWTEDDGFDDIAGEF